MILYTRNGTQWQVVGSCNVRGPHDASPDCVTHCYVCDPCCGCGDDAADLGFCSDCFSAYADLGLDCDYRWRWRSSVLKSKHTSLM